MLIDGGAGQLSAARGVLNDLGVPDVKLVGIAKGPDRDAGREWFHTLDKDGVPNPPFQLPPRDPVLYYLQRVRDESPPLRHHHPPRWPQQDAGDERAGRDRRRGVGAQAGAAESFRIRPQRQAAGLTDLEATPGINRETARRIYAHFHPGASLAGS